MPTKLSIGDLSSALAIGSLSFLGLFFVIDHFMDLWSFFEAYTGATTWNVVIAIPTLVIIYTIGLLNLQFSDFIFSKFYKRKLTDEFKRFLIIADKDNNAITQKYSELKRLQVFFQSCFFAFLILGIGTSLTYKWVGGYEILSFILGFGLIIIGIICPIFSKAYHNQIVVLADLIESKINNIEQTEYNILYK